MAVRASNATTFTFQRSKIWEGSNNNLDATYEPVNIKHKDEAGARGQLPEIGMGRKWILIAINGEKVKK